MTCATRNGRSVRTGLTNTRSAATSSRSATNGGNTPRAAPTGGGGTGTSGLTTPTTATHGHCGKGVATRGWARGSGTITTVRRSHGRRTSTSGHRKWWTKGRNGRVRDYGGSRGRCGRTTSSWTRLTTVTIRDGTGPNSTTPIRNGGCSSGSRLGRWISFLTSQFTTRKEGVLDACLGAAS